MGKNQLKAKDKAIHGWYRFVLAYPPHLVREYLQKLEADPERDWVFDPFSGTATTPVEARLNGFSVIGTDANPISVLANKVKLEWDLDLDAVYAAVCDVSQRASEHIRVVHLLPLPISARQKTLFDGNIEDLLAINNKHTRRVNDSDFDPDDFISADERKILPKGFISERPLKRVLAIRYAIDELVPEGNRRGFLQLALANTILTTAGNVAFGPEIYSTQPKDDADVLGSFYSIALSMIEDLREILTSQPRPYPVAYIAQDDARVLSCLGKYPQIGTVITSPPYPNEKDYTRTTRLENVLLGFISSRRDLRALKETLLRSNTRNVYVKDDDDRYIRDIPAIVNLASEIEKRRIDLGKTSGFEKLYHRVTTLYFGGMYRHLASLLPRLRPGGKCAYVVGDQMSYFRIHIPTAHLLADVALKAGYRVEGIETWRNRFSTVTKQYIEENVLILKRPE
jgi:DNA modification methylase